MKISKVIIPMIGALGLTISHSAFAKKAESGICLSSVDLFKLKHAERLPENSLRAYTKYASLGKHFNTGGERAFVFDPRNKRWGAYDRDGYLVASGIANGGADFCAELGRSCHTPVGAHRIRSKGSPECVSSKYPLGVGGAPMPYCMFFNGGYAIHGSPYISNRNGSHGCIRVHTGAARWLSKHFFKHGTKVIVLPY